jgi:hypothetical protein
VPRIINIARSIFKDYWLALAAVVGLALVYPDIPGHPAAEPQQALLTLTYLAVGVALSYAAFLVIPKKDEALIKDDKPTTLSKRGSFVTWFIGRRRIGPVFAWAGDRATVKERVSGGGKGFSKKKKTRVFVERGWHLLSVGPVESLQRIYQNGAVIFEGPITKDSHPSGTTVSLGKEGQFIIYWGEPDQPVNTTLGDASRVGVSSRWPNLCYVLWSHKRLGASPVWPMIEYELERRPSTAILGDTEPWMGPNYTATGTTYSVVDHSDGPEGYGYLVVEGNQVPNFPPSSKITLAGNSMANGTYDVLDSEVFMYDSDPDPLHVYYVTRTKVYLFGGVSGANDTGTLESWDTDSETGVNAAHAIADMLFAAWPYGLGLSQSHWDMDSLEAMGVQTDTEATGGEDLWTSWISQGGDTVATVLAAGLQDLGYMLQIDSSSGKLQFVAIRQPSGSLEVVNQDMLLPPLPRREINLGPLPADQLIFSFPDQARRYRTMTLDINDDGTASFAEYSKAKTVQLTIVDHFDVAARTAERRSQEMLAGGAAFTINTTRGCREFYPGQAIQVYGFEEVLRVLSVQFDPDTNKVVLEVIPDYYGAVLSDFLPSYGAGIFEATPTENDEYMVVEVPETLLGGKGPQAILVPRIRAHEQITEAEVHISSDGSTFTSLETQVDYHLGGHLIDTLAADTLTMIDEGPTFTVFGDDIADALDLSADTDNWRAGRQMCAINGELFYLQKVTAVSGTTYRLDGLIRARYDTVKEAHAAGDLVVIFTNSDTDWFQDILLQPSSDIYVKSQPTGIGGPIPLDQVPYRELELYGKGVVPPPARNVRLSAPYPGSPTYTTGEDLVAKWSFYSNSGAGFRDAGDAQGDETVDGQFLVEILNSSDVVIRSDSTSAAEYTYSNATMVSDFSGEPASLKIRVSVSRDGYQSSTLTYTVEKVS